MGRTILIYGSVLAMAVLLLKALEYKFFYRQLSPGIYIGMVSILFTILGVWIGRQVTRNKKIFISGGGGEFRFNQEALVQTGISKRELEVLELMAKGLSNQEIADRLFVSLNTVKTHTANLFLKLEARRRTQAIQRAKEIGLIP